MWQPMFIYTTGFFLLLFSCVFRKFRPPIFWLIFIALIPRITYLLLFLEVESFDTLALASNADLTLKKINIYANHAQLRYPYFPLFIYIEAFSLFLSKFQIPMALTFRSILILFDITVIVMLYLFDRQNNTNNSFLYSLAPIPILVSSFHGQFDAIAILLILFTLFFLEKRKEFIAIISLSTAIALKTWPLIFVYPLFLKLKNSWNILWIPLIPIMSMVFYMNIFKAQAIDILRPIASYSGVQQPLWGISFVIYQLFGDVDQVILKTLQDIFLLSFFVFVLFSSKKESLERTILSILLFFFSFTIHSGIQWFLWLIPFLFLVRPKGWWVLYFLLSGFVISHYASWVQSDNSSIKYFSLVTRNFLTWTSVIAMIIIFVKSIWFAYIHQHTTFST